MSPFSRLLLLFILTFGFFSCEKIKNITADEFVEASIKAHGMEDSNKKNIEFVFRKYQYTQAKDSEGIIYSRRKIVAPETIDFHHSKNGFRRTFNDNPVVISDSLSFVFKVALNSVLYFYRLPYALLG